MSFDSRRFRDALGCFATGITVVTARAADGAPLGVTVNSFNSVSLDPPLVLFSLDRSAARFAEFSAAGHFAVNVLRDDQQDLSHRFASRGNDAWEGLDVETGESGCPLLPGVLAVFECELETTYDGGDHVIFIGRVRHIDHLAAGTPLLYFRGGYTHLARAAQDSPEAETS
jgi:flavin reductase (DIM6/NTAB) family NADH-FMN oxidoreductase RutF